MIEDAIKVLEQERDRISAAIALLRGSASAPPVAKTTKRTFSPEARARISAALKKRWAERKKTEKRGIKG